jgi:hypothetical protein
MKLITFLLSLYLFIMRPVNWVTYWVMCGWWRFQNWKDRRK